MKVLHVIPSLSTVHGGPTRALALMERALLAQGIAVETATTDDAGPGRHSGKPCGRPLAEDDAVRWYFGKTFEFYKPSVAFAGWIAREVRRYDLVHIHALFSFTSTNAAWAARRAGVPYIVRPLGTLNAYGMQQRRPWAKTLSMRLIESRILRHAAAVHFTSEQEAQEAGQLGIPMRQAIIPLAVEPAATAFHPSRFASLRGAPCLLFLSRLDPKKNVEALLDAAALLSNEMPALRVLIAGDGPPAYVATLRARAASLGIAPRVMWTGHLEGAVKAAAFAAADVFVLPSHSENFGIAAAEALAAGVPCLLGNGVAIASEVAEAGAGIAVGTDAPGVCAALRRMIGDKEGLIRMSVHARCLAQQRYSVEAMGAALKHLYIDILNGSNGIPGSR